MKLHDFQLQTFSKWITFIPTIEVHIDNPMYNKKNIALILNIFIWHFRWLFINESEEYMACDKCKHFKILYEPLRTEGVMWDMGRAKCDRRNLITDFANHGKFKRLETCENYEPQESEE